jgi:ferric-dicitrate binding protein FerR (iron transport regulator)
MRRLETPRMRLGSMLASLVLVGMAPAALAQAQAPGAELALIQQIRMTDGGEGMRAAPGGDVDRLVQLDLGDLLNDGDDAFTLSGTRAAIRFTDDQSLVRMNENTVLRVRAEGTDRGSLRRIIELEGGELWARITGKPGTETQIRTPSGVAAVRGTDFIVRHDPATGQTTVITLEGLLEFFNAAGLVEIPAGRKTSVGSEDQAPQTTPVQPEDLDPTRRLLEDQAEEEDQDVVEVTITGIDGRSVTIRVPRSVLQQIGRSR